jgi:hypothetical protein
LMNVLFWLKYLPKPPHKLLSVWATSIKWKLTSCYQIQYSILLIFSFLFLFFDSSMGWIQGLLLARRSSTTWVTPPTWTLGFLSLMLSLSQFTRSPCENREEQRVMWKHGADQPPVGENTEAPSAHVNKPCSV